MEQQQPQELMRPPLSENQLIEKLVGAKKVMNAVDGGEYSEGTVDMSKFTAPEIPTGMPDSTQTMPQNMQQTQNPALNEERIRNSKLPDAIKEAMIKNPIHQPSIDATQQMDMKIFENAKRLMNEDNPNPRKEQSPTRKHFTKTQPSVDASSLAASLEPIIENVVRKVLDEKLTQILSAHDTGTINENLAIKVGDSIFHGKITKVKNSK